MEAKQKEEKRLKFEAQCAAKKRMHEYMILKEAEKRIKEAAEAAAFESAVQEKMRELLASASTIESRMKIREIELKELFN